MFHTARTRRETIVTLDVLQQEKGTAKRKTIIRYRPPGFFKRLESLDSVASSVRIDFSRSNGMFDNTWNRQLRGGPNSR
jgi:hypothetical protein